MLTLLAIFQDGYMSTTNTVVASSAGTIASDPVPVHRIVDVDGIPMSALLIEVPEPRAVILTVHGGATNSAYFDCPGHPRLSLLHTAAALGFTVLALDRPGYGSSNPHATELVDPDVRVDVTYAALERHLEGIDRGAGVFVLAHSIGCELATRLAADDRGDAFLGIELSGTGREQQPLAQEILGVTARNADPIAVRELLWQPSRLYPEELFGGLPIASRTPKYEGDVVRSWPRENFPNLAARVNIPVHFTAGEYEHVWRNDPEALLTVAELFTAAPRVVVDKQFDGGHNLSLGYTATAYHLRVLAFVEECIAGRSEFADLTTDDSTAAHASHGR